MHTPEGRLIFDRLVTTANAAHLNIKVLAGGTAQKHVVGNVQIDGIARIELLPAQTDEVRSARAEDGEYESPRNDSPDDTSYEAAEQVPERVLVALRPYIRPARGVQKDRDTVPGDDGSRGDH